MRLITAIIKPFKLEQVREALMQSGVQGMTVTEVRGVGRGNAHTEAYRGAEYGGNLMPKLKIEVVADDDIAARVVDAIAQAAHSGSAGDGKIFVAAIEQAIRIRTGEVDEVAL
ncbi:MAG: P-II family nitrogen regulator [Sphingomonadales bacterium]|jgi:nitrogen regulatory protein PII